MRVVESLSIFFKEPDDGVVDPCHLRYGACKLDVLNHSQVGLSGFLDDSEVAVPPTIILISLMGGLRRSFSRRGACSWGGPILSLLTNLCSFPYLIRASICCFKL